MNRATFTVTGMSCDGCERTVENSLGNLEGVTIVDADYSADAVGLLGVPVGGEQAVGTTHELGATVEQTAETMHIHPTLPESSNSTAGGVHNPPERRSQLLFKTRSTPRRRTRRRESPA